MLLLAAATQLQAKTRAQCEEKCRHIACYQCCTNAYNEAQKPCFKKCADENVACNQEGVRVCTKQYGYSEDARQKCIRVKSYACADKLEVCIAPCYGPDLKFESNCPDESKEGASGKGTAKKKSGR